MTVAADRSLMTPEQVAQFLNVEPALIEDLARDGHFEHYKVGPLLRFSTDKLQTFLSNAASNRSCHSAPPTSDSGADPAPLPDTSLPGATARSAVRETVSPSRRRTRHDNPVGTSQLFTRDLIRAGDRVFVEGHDDAVATVADGLTVMYGAHRMTFTEFGKRVTGWQAINAYKHIVHAPSGKLLAEIRRDYTDHNVVPRTGTRV